MRKITKRANDKIRFEAAMKGIELPDTEAMEEPVENSPEQQKLIESRLREIEAQKRAEYGSGPSNQDQR